MQQYNVFQAFYMSFYSKSLYRDVAVNWGGKAFLYLLLLLCLSWIVATIELQSTINRGYNKDADKIAAQIPVLTIKNGKLTTPENHPYIIEDPDSKQPSKQPIAIIDTSGQYTSLSQTNTSILITQTQLITRSNPNEVKTNQIPNTLNIIVNPQTYNAYLKKFLGVAWIFIFIFLVLATYIYRILQALLYAIIGKIFSAITGSKVSYGQIVQIMLVALTPVIIISTVLDALNITFAHIILYYFLLAVLYLFFGIVANKT